MLWAKKEKAFVTCLVSLVRVWAGPHYGSEQPCAHTEMASRVAGAQGPGSMASSRLSSPVLHQLQRDFSTIQVLASCFVWKKNPQALEAFVLHRMNCRALLTDTIRPPFPPVSAAPFHPAVYSIHTVLPEAPAHWCFTLDSLAQGSSSVPICLGVWRRILYSSWGSLTPWNRVCRFFSLSTLVPWGGSQYVFMGPGQLCLYKLLFQ